VTSGHVLHLSGLWLRIPSDRIAGSLPDPLDPAPGSDMTTDPFSYRLEQPDDIPAIETLHREAFGPGRFARAAYRLREGVPHDPELSFVARAGERLIASVRLTPIAIGGRPALLLGPLVVFPPLKGLGAGKNLVRIAVDAARAAGHEVVMLVGDEAYYGSLGFSQLIPHAITLPGPVDPGRVLVCGLKPGALEGLSGPAARRP
jgi:predicted N-acetyltransferase YhbS